MGLGRGRARCRAAACLVCGRHRRVWLLGRVGQELLRKGRHTDGPGAPPRRAPTPPSRSSLASAAFRSASDCARCRRPAMALSPAAAADESSERSVRALAEETLRRLRIDVSSTCGISSPNRSSTIASRCRAWHAASTQCDGAYGIPSSSLASPRRCGTLSTRAALAVPGRGGGAPGRTLRRMSKPPSWPPPPPPPPLPPPLAAPPAPPLLPPAAAPSAPNGTEVRKVLSAPSSVPPPTPTLLAPSSIASRARASIVSPLRVQTSDDASPP